MSWLRAQAGGATVASRDVTAAEDSGEWRCERGSRREEAADEPNPIDACADDGTHSVILVVIDEDGGKSAATI